MILVVGGIKGGTGKTTLATNLTVLRSKKKKVLLIDADEQRSATDWYEQRQALAFECPWSLIQFSGKSLYSEIKKRASHFDDIIVDVGGRDTTSQRSALSVANCFLIPFKPRSYDIWTVEPLRKMISEIKTINPKLKSYAIINQGESRGSDNQKAIEILSECKELICIKKAIAHRKAFSNAASEGRGVMELYNDKDKALEELQYLYNFIYG